MDGLLITGPEDGNTGPQGPTGPTGPQGPPGSPPEPYSGPRIIVGPKNFSGLPQQEGDIYFAIWGQLPPFRMFVGYDNGDGLVWTDPKVGP